MTTLPRGVVETHLVQSLADDSWRLNRAKAMENNLYALGLHDKSDSILTQNDQVRGALAMAASLGDQTKALATLSLHQARIALDAAQREFVRRAGPWARQREPRKRKAADATEEPPLHP